MRRWAWLWLPAAFFVMCASWALTSPAGSSPDDDYHLTSIWCAAGIESGRCEGVPGDPLARRVPAAVVDASTCFAFDDEVTAACKATLPDTMVETIRVNETAGLYPSLYYRAMALLVGPDVERSVLGMRLANAALASVLLALMLRVVPLGIRYASLTAVTVGFIPLGLFVVASTNPSGWAVVGVGLFWAFALALLHRRDWRNRRTWLIAAGTVVTGTMAAGARIDAAAYVVLAAALVGILTGPRRLRAAPVSTAVVVVVAAFGAVTYLLAGSPGGQGDPMGGADPGIGLLLTNLVFLPVLVQQAVGGGALGWNDTVLPPLAPIVGTLALGALAYRGLGSMGRRKATAVAVAFAGLVCIPLWFLQKEGLGVGEVVQARYLLPLVLLLLSTLCLGPRPRVALALPRVPGLVLAVALTGSAVLSLWVNAHRYSIGSGFGIFDINPPVAWTAADLPLPAILVVGAAATAAFVLGSLWLVSDPAGRGRRQARPTAPASVHYR